MFTMLIIIVLIQILFSSYFSLALHSQKAKSIYKNKSSWPLLDSLHNEPKSWKEKYESRRKNIIFSVLASSVGLILPKVQRSNAIGSIYEFKDQYMCLQDISFNVVNTEAEAKLFAETFQDTCKVLRTETFGEGEKQTVIGFGPDSYKSPTAFRPGISTFYEDGGHATITLHSRVVNEESGLVEVYQPGNGLEFIKIGTDSLRLSKAVALGSKLKYAYGWVDLDTPENLPIEIVVGVARDPMMLASLKVSNINGNDNVLVENLFF
jgi:hypothetical protein